MKLLKNTWKNRSLVLMALPAVILMILFQYIPMFGLVLAFKKYNFADGIWGSPWNGLENFRYLFSVGDTAWRLTRNTVGYFLLFTAVNTFLEVMIAIGINEMVKEKLAKYFQSAMILPTFISYIAVSFIVYALLKTGDGIISRMILELGGEEIRFYLSPQYWPWILTIVNAWKGVGYGSVLYLSVLAGVDRGLYESAAIDGANARQKVWYITIPMLVPMVIVKTLLAIGQVMHSNTGLFYQVTRNSGAIKATTDVLDSYVLNAIANSIDYGMTGATTFYQSLVGFVLVIATNAVVRKISPENALF